MPRKMPKNYKRGRMLMTPEQREQHNREMVEKFDIQFPVGTEVWYWSSFPFGPKRKTRIREGAYYIPSYDGPVCKVIGVPGCVSTFHITPILEGD